MNPIPTIPRALVRDLKAALAILLRRRCQFLDAIERRRWAAMQLRMVAARLEHGVYDLAETQNVLETTR